MKSTHAGMSVSSSDFDALVGDLVAALNKFKVGEREKNELLGALGPMNKDIVPSSAAMTDPRGMLPLPASYKSWPKFLTDIPKGEANQVRDIYINPTGAGTSSGQNFPNGTVMVMEICKAKMDGDKLMTGMDGKPVKDDLAQMFVMGKEQGWGDKQPENLKNGDWALYCLRCFQQAADGGFHKVPRLPHAAGAERFRPPLRRIFPNESAADLFTYKAALLISAIQICVCFLHLNRLMSSWRNT